MKSILRKLFSPLLNPLESGHDQYSYKPSHRVILLVMSGLFIGLASLVFALMPSWDAGYWLPIVVFGGAGLMGIIVAALGDNRAVAKLWGSK